MAVSENLRLGLGALFLALALLLPGPAAAAPVDEALFKKIEANLICVDGCGMLLATCDNEVAGQERAQIRELLAGGATEEQVYAYMLNVYGEEVLAAPPTTSALNVMAWVLPFLGILAGGFFAYLLLDRWVFNRRARAVQLPVPEEDLAAYEDLLEAELRKYL
ncbi:MAG: cytochrome c-type biosis protein CcmH [Clostridia bacterium]|nr:cytochrome c-type biosis protein CcmH [Clostridia bacterium]